MGDLSVSPRELQRIVGVCFLILLFVGPVAIVYIPGEIQSHIGTSTDGIQTLLSQGILADLVVIVTECFMVPALFLYLAPADRALSLFAAVARFAEVMIMCVNMFWYVVAGAISGGAIGGAIPAVADSSRNSTLSMLVFIHNVGAKLWEIPFGVHIVLVGYIVAFRCLFFPKYFGHLLIVGGCGYVLDAFAGLLFANYGELSVSGNATGDNLQTFGSALACVGEIPFFLYVVAQGCDVAAWHQQSAKTSAALLDDQDF